MVRELLLAEQEDTGLTQAISNYFFSPQLKGGKERLRSSDFFFFGGGGGHCTQIEINLALAVLPE